MKNKMLFLFMLLVCLSVNAENRVYKLWYDQPAPNRGGIVRHMGRGSGYPSDDDWQRWSLPLGNGYMGINVFGRTDTERIQLSEATLANASCYNLGGFTNFAEIFLDINHYGLSKYNRTLYLNNGIGTVNYRHCNVTYNRECFVNYPSNVIAVKLIANKPGQISLRVRPVIPYIGAPFRTNDNRKGKVTAQGDLITLSGKMDFCKLAFEAQVKVVPYGGTMKSENDTNGNNGIITISQADSLVLYIAAGTSYKLSQDLFLLPQEQKCAGNEHPHQLVSDRIEKAVNMGYKALKEEHVNDFQGLFDRVCFFIGNKIPSIPTDRLLKDYAKKTKKNTDNDAYLEELCFQYGRYLLISSARPNTLPPNLQGVWAQQEYCPWSGGYWHNVNVQMNYWPAFTTNLAETFEAFVKYNEAYRKKAQELASDIIKINNPQNFSDKEGENGWCIGTAASAYSITGPGGQSGPGSGGFTTKLFWDYYDFTRDRKVLEEHTYPALEGMAKFLSKTLHLDNEGHLLASPSQSPEQMINRKPINTIGCTYDQGMIWENFNDLLNAADLLKKKSPFLDLVKEQITKLDPILIGESGQLKEYREENKYGELGDPHHRHISHLCTLYPGTLVNTNPEWERAAGVSLKLRQGNSIDLGWASAHRQNAWARLKKAEEAYGCYRTFISHSVYQNLWSLFPIYQIDGNLGTTAGVAEMLLQSHEGYIAILPALPKEWSNGSYKGLVARGNFEVAVSWNNSKATHISIHSRSGEVCKLHYKNIGSFILTDSRGKVIKKKVLSPDMIQFKTKKNETYRINFLLIGSSLN